MNDVTDPSTPQDAPRSDIDEILRGKRKAREHKACYPCRQRKVKCDTSTPCRRCVERDHPELCDYHPPGKRRRRDNGKQTSKQEEDDVAISSKEWSNVRSKLSTIERSIAELKVHLGLSQSEPPPQTHTNRELPESQVEHRPSFSQGIYAKDDLTGNSIHLGASSAPALAMALSEGRADQPAVQELLSRSILPLFGLDNNTATYPFVDLWALQHGALPQISQLCQALPADLECIEFFRSYRDIAHVVYPAVVDIHQLESDLMLFLTNRASRHGLQDHETKQLYGKDLDWVGLLFAALASGCQCSSLPRKQRELTSQVYVCCAFECLRLTNYFCHASLDSIQNLLILGHVLSNNMNAGVAWSLIGLTTRIAQSVGIHEAKLSLSESSLQSAQQKIWWMIIWQDGLLSISYDRATSSTAPVGEIPFGVTSSPGYRTYAECMYKLCRVTLQIVRSRAQESDGNTLYIIEQGAEIDRIMADAADYLKDVRKCRSIRDQIEHWNLYLHTSYITSELCRRAISPGVSQDEEWRTLRVTCIDSLMNTVDAFLGLRNISPSAARSWATMHRGISSALLLAILRETISNPRAQSLVGAMVSVLSDITASIDQAELPGPICRSIAALRKLSFQESSVPGVIDDLEPGFSLDNGPSQSQDIRSDLRETRLFPTPSPLLARNDEPSPYSLMDSILWGA